MDHSRQGAGQPQSKLRDGVPSTRSPTHAAQRTVLGLWHWGKETEQYDWKITVSEQFLTSMLVSF